MAGVVALVGLGVGLVAPGGSAPPEGEALPEELVGLRIQRSAAAARTSSALAERLAAEPSVLQVAVGAWSGSGRVLVVLDVAPRTAFSDTTAGELVDRVLGAAPGPGGTSDRPVGAGEVVSAVSDDGLALLSCRDPEPGTSLCVSVEADRALVLLVSDDQDDDTEDPLRLTAAVRDEVRAHRD